MRSVRDIPVYKDIPIIVRAALNVPLQDGRVTNDYRLRRALPTLSYLAERGARVVIISHSGEKGTETLEPIAKALGTLVPNVSFCPETIGPRAREAVRTLSPGHLLVLENLRRDAREVANDLSFSKEIAALGDVFVQDSFDTCHRPHASIIGVPTLLPSYAGLTLEEEVTELSQALSPKHPALAIIGGAKFSTKEPVLTRLLASYDTVFVGGALANDFWKAQGHAVGKSLVSLADSDHIKTIMDNPKLRMPVDARVVPESTLTNEDVHSDLRVATTSDVKDDEVIVDHGPGTVTLLQEQARAAKTILWNGPFGMYEKGCVDTTDAFAQAVADSGAFSVVGGGDTIAAIEKLGLLPKFSFVSTGGGAMLDFLAEGTLPGIVALG